jgi:hypothetical protein
MKISKIEKRIGKLIKKMTVKNVYDTELKIGVLTQALKAKQIIKDIKEH